MASLNTTRRLATILAADVVGYSRLMAEDEEATVHTLKAHRKIIDRLIARHEGRIFHAAGDSVLAEFGSAVEAVRCAITIQDELRVRNAELDEPRQMNFRVGVNIGDVIVDGDDLLGDGVNVAARLEGIAPPGGICISGSTFEQVKNKLSIGFEALGPQSVKNIPDPVAAFRITAAPVMVSSGEDPLPATPVRSRPAVGVAVVAVLGAVAVWLLYPGDPSPPPAVPTTPPAATVPAQPVVPTPAKQPAPMPFPASTAPSPPLQPPPTVTVAPSPPAPAPREPLRVATADLSAGEIAALVAGLTIEGIRKKDGQPFTIVLHDDRSASHAYPRSGAGAGTTFRSTGRWWTENGRFCMQFRGFNQGEESCPQFVREGSQVTANRPDGTPLKWTVKRTATESAAPIRSGGATSTDEMRADEIHSLVAGLTVHGTRLKDQRPFTIALQPDGTAGLELVRPDGGRFRETGTWSSEDYRFCMQFAQFNNGQQMCPRIVRQDDRLAVTRGDGTPLPWSLQR